MLLCLVTYLPGVMLLPPIDRSEVKFAASSQDVAAEGRWLDPRYGNEVDPRRSIGTYWAQALSARLAGADSDAPQISTYRLPSLLALTAATLALFFLAGPLVGSQQALLAAGFFAVAPLTVLIATLALADGLALMWATVALLSLLRIYAAKEHEPTRGLALLFWCALGAAMLVNALQVPTLVAVIILALVAVDRDASWLKRTHPLPGLVVAMAIAAPWLIVRALQDGGTPYGDLSLEDLLDALMGSQDMELKSWPGSFVLVPLLGFLPGLAVMADTAVRLWGDRERKITRFLLCWMIAWIVFLELTSDKPATYSVQFVFPAFALAVAGFILKSGATRQSLRWSLILPAPIAVAFFLALILAPFAAAQQWPGVAVAVLAFAVAALAALAGRATTLVNWSLLAIATFALFSGTLLGVALPSIKKIWTAHAISRAVESCGGKPIRLIGFREPSAAFVLGTPKKHDDRSKLIGAQDRIHVVESRWIERFRAEAERHNLNPTELTCVETFNAVRACPLTFTVFALDGTPRACRTTYEDTCARLHTQTRPNATSCE